MIILHVWQVVFAAVAMLLLPLAVWADYLRLLASARRERDEARANVEALHEMIETMREKRLTSLAHLDAAGRALQ